MFNDDNVCCFCTAKVQGITSRTYVTAFGRKRVTYVRDVSSKYLYLSDLLFQAISVFGASENELDVLTSRGCLDREVSI